MHDYSFQMTPLAVQDIDDALSYIRDTLYNPHAAQNLVREIHASIQKICSFPFAYPDCVVYLIQDKNIRHINIKHYVMIYEVDIERSSIRILRFLYSKMDFSKLLLS